MSMESDSDEGREGELERLSGLTRTLEPASYCIGAIIRESESEGIEELVERDEFLHEYLFNQQLKNKTKKHVPLKEIPLPLLWLNTFIDEESVSDALAVWEFLHVFRFLSLLLLLLLLL